MFFGRGGGLVALPNVEIRYESRIDASQSVMCTKFKHLKLKLTSRIKIGFVSAGVCSSMASLLGLMRLLPCTGSAFSQLLECEGSGQPAFAWVYHGMTDNGH